MVKIMQLEEYSDINAVTVRKFREHLGLSLKVFWGAVGCTVSNGSAYETGKSEMREAVKRLVYMHYAAGIPTDPKSEEFVSFVRQMSLADNARVANARGLIEKSVEQLRDALEIVGKQ